MLLPSLVRALKQLQWQDQTWHPAFYAGRQELHPIVLSLGKKQLISALFERTKDFLII